MYMLICVIEILNIIIIIYKGKKEIKSKKNQKSNNHYTTVHPQIALW